MVLPPILQKWYGRLQSFTSSKSMVINCMKRWCLPCISCKDKIKSKTSAATNVYKFYCAQLVGEQMKHKLTKTGKQRVWITMDRFKCNGWVSITLNANNLTMAGIWITHYRYHWPYVDILISEDIAKQIEKLKDLSAVKVITSLFCGPSLRY